jgi:hypothetical protein
LLFCVALVALIDGASDEMRQFFTVWRRAASRSLTVRLAVGLSRAGKPVSVKTYA